MANEDKQYGDAMFIYAMALMEEQEMKQSGGDNDEKGINEE